MLSNDLRSNDCSLLFWNWEIEAAGVVCRWEPKLKEFFIFGKTVEEVIKENWKWTGSQEFEPEP